MVNFNPLQAPKSIFLVLAVCLIVSILPIISSLDLSASPLEKIGYDWDNVKEFKINDLTSKYGKYEIRNSILGIPFLSLSKVADIELINNSDVCGESCFAEKEITLYNDGILIDEITFKTLQEDGSWIKQDIRNYRFSYQGEIQDYKTVCVDEKELSLNGTKTQTCTQVTDGTHIGKINYNEGDVVKAGTYLLRLEGAKKPSRTVDWIVKSNGIWTNEWAVWGNISAGDDAEVILNSPADELISLTNEVIFNATANVTGGATLTNMTLYNNISGSWIANRTKFFSRLSFDWADSITSYYKLDVDSSTQVDSVLATGNNATVNGSTYTASGLFGGAYSFDGVNDNIVTDNNVNLGIDDFSISLWTKTLTNTQYGHLFSNFEIIGNNFVINQGFSEGNLTLTIGPNTATTSIFTNKSLHDNIWHNIIATKEGTNYSIYLDNIYEGSATWVGTLDDDQISIGSSMQSSNYFTGTIDEVGIWNKALTLSEITEIYSYRSRTSTPTITLTSPTNDTSI